MEETCVQMDRKCKLGVLFNEICKTSLEGELEEQSL